MEQKENSLNVRVKNKTLTVFFIWIAVIIGFLEGQFFAQAANSNGDKTVLY